MQYKNKCETATFTLVLQTGQHQLKLTDTGKKTALLFSQVKVLHFQWSWIPNENQKCWWKMYFTYRLKLNIMKVLVVLALAVFTGKNVSGLINSQSVLTIQLNNSEMLHQQVAKPTSSMLMSPSHSWSSWQMISGAMLRRQHKRQRKPSSWSGLPNWDRKSSKSRTFTCRTQLFRVFLASWEETQMFFSISQCQIDPECRYGQRICRHPQETNGSSDWRADD